MNTAGCTPSLFDSRVFRLVTLFLVVSGLVLPLTGCPIRVSRPGVTVVVWDGPRWADASGNRYHWIQRKIEEFESNHPFVEVVLEPMEWANLRPMLDAAKEAGRLPDLAPFDISAGGIALDEIDAGLLEPADGFLADQKDISPQALAAYTYKGHLWGFPSSMTAHALLLSLDLFAERGVQPPTDGKWTWGEFVEACRRLTYDRDQDGKVDTWGFATYVLPGYYEAWPFVYADGGRPLSDDLQTYTFDTPAAIAGLKRLTDLILVDKAAHPTTGSASARGVFDLFATPDGKERVAIEPWSAWAIDYLKAQPNTIKSFAVTEYPTGATGQPVTIGGTGGFVVFRQDSPGKRSQVMALANFLTNATAQYEMARGYHVFPARKKALDLDPFRGDPAYRKAAEIAFHAESLPRHPRWPEIERLIQREIQMALLGIKGPEEALTDAGVLVAPLLGPPAAPNPPPSSAPPAGPG